MSTLNTGFEGYSDDDLLTKGRLIQAKLSEAPGSTDFPTSATMVGDLHDLLDTFELRIQAGNAPGAAEDRETARAAVTTQLKLLAALLESVSLDRDKLAHTGYDLRKEPEHNADPTAMPENVVVKPTGIPGEAKLSCAGVPHVLTYEYQWTLDPNNGPWTEVGIVPNIRSMLVTGLERGKDTWFRIRAFGPNGASPWSDPATMMVI